MTKPWITIAGCGPGGLDYITPAALTAIQQADVLVGAVRLLASFPGNKARQIPVGADVDSALDQMKTCKGRKVTVLVTGDPGLCSLAKPVIKRFGLSACRIIPGISSVQTAFARAGSDWQDARIINAHSGHSAIPPASLAGLPKIAVLAGHESARGWLQAVADVLGRSYRIVICENLTLANERVRTVTPTTLKSFKMTSRCIILWIKKEK
jgi:precorrin-6y C5,15-methyltransferase (decarboxylating) CbiE subunit